MDKSQKLALILISAGILIGVIIIVASGGALQTVQQSAFRAAPGTELDAAQPLFSETAEETEQASPQTEEPAQIPESPVPPPDSALPETPPPSDAPPEALSPVDQALLRAQNALNPSTGVDRIEELLASLENLGEASRLYAAKADLQLRLDPPDLGGAAAAASEALKYAGNAEEKDAAACVEIDVLRRAGDLEKAQQRAAEVFSAGGTTTSNKLRAGLLYATMKRDAGDAEAAEQAYRDIIQKVTEEGEALGEQSADLHRQAALNLVQVLRELGRREEADKVAEEFDAQTAPSPPGHQS